MLDSVRYMSVILAWQLHINIQKLVSKEVNMGATIAYRVYS